MAGHSKWKNIQARKSVQDAKKGKAFTKAAKELMIAAKAGSDPAGNARLRAAIAAAKAVNLPKDKIDLAIKKGSGELGGGTIDEVMYEGYGPGGVALLVEAATDNRNRTVAEVRSAFNKGGGAMGEAGSVSWMFDKRGVFAFPKADFAEDVLMEAALDAGAEDVSGEDEEVWQVMTLPENFTAVQEAFDAAGLKYVSAELSMIPQNTISVDVETGQKLLRLVETLEDNDDVQQVHANFDLPDELLG